MKLLVERRRYKGGLKQAENFGGSPSIVFVTMASGHFTSRVSVQDVLGKILNDSARN